MATGCRATNQAGAPCSAQPLPSGWCRWHDPSLAADRAAWSRKGGENRSNKRRARKAIADPMTPTELQALLGMTLRGVIAGRIEPGVGNAAASLGRALVVIREATTLEERIAELEAAAGTASTTKGWRA